MRWRRTGLFDTITAQRGRSRVFMAGIDWSGSTAARCISGWPQVVRWDASGVAPGRALALATCWPLDAKTHGPLRYLVWATPWNDKARGG
jgi:hypothetical protein